MVLPPARPFTHYRLQCPSPSGTSRLWDDEPTRAFIWNTLRLETDVPEVGRRLFTGKLAERNSLWNEFRNYLRQARTYDASAELIRGSSGALLLYYAALNMAKAELLISTPTAITGKRIGHGLRFEPTKVNSLATSYVVVEKGVFPLLYEKRLGTPVKAGTKLAFRRLAKQAPEIGWELEQLGLGKNRTSELMHAAVSDEGAAWSLVALSQSEMFLSGATGKTLLAAFKHVQAPPEWQRMFSVSSRIGRGDYEFLELRDPTHQRPSWHGDLDPETGDAVSAAVWRALQAFIDEPMHEAADAVLAASLYGTRMEPMTASLARYALMYLFSSIVRYKPSLLDPSACPQYAWLADSFVDQAASRMLRSALCKLTGTAHQFYSGSAFRR